MKNPGFEEDLIVRTDVRTLTRVWIGHSSFDQAVREKALTLEGAPAFKRAFPPWLQLSPFAPIEAPRTPASP